MHNYHEDALKLLITIVDRGKGERIAEIADIRLFHISLMCLGHGTADSEIMDLLGLGSTDKDVLLTLTPYSHIPQILADISDKMQLKKPGKGIAFILPLSGINKLTSDVLLHDNPEIESEVKKMEDDVKYQLIIAALNPGYSEQVMDAAKASGATGGTVLNARGVRLEGFKRVLGISLQDKKELLIILAPAAVRTAIMKAISEKFGLKTDCKAIVMSLPVDGIAGIG